MSNQLLTHDEIVRAWKDEAYRSSLSEAQRQYAGENYPAGEMELSDAELEQIAGGAMKAGGGSCCWSSCN
jgi:mersacidin/lichenicidin family type 2 lantibiotic